MEREFDAHHEQWNFALRQVDTECALAQDADYQVMEEVVVEIVKIPDATSGNRFFVKFDYGGWDAG